MRTLSKTILAATAAVGIAGAGGFALAAAPDIHIMTVRLPDGATAKIQYTGNVPPKVTIGESPIDADFFPPLAPFDMFDAISARMDREMNWLFQHATPVNADGLFAAGIRIAPSGSMKFSMVSTVTSNGACMRQTQITSTGKGKPKIISRTSGNCGKDSASGVSEQPFDNGAVFGNHLQSVSYVPRS